MAASAHPQLASTIFTTLNLSKGHLRDGAPPTGLLPTIGTSIQSLDDMLRGGLSYGSVHCISSEPGTAVAEILLGLLSTHLLSDTGASATVIDTSSFLDLRRLHQRLLEALQTRKRDDSEALTVLERLKIMKVFDFVGLTEGLSELRHDLENNARPGEAEDGSEQVKRRTWVGDSDEEDEMLDSEEPETAINLPRDKPANISNKSPRVLIIDNFSNIAGPVLKRSAAQGNALLASTIRSISQLTKAHQLCTVLSIDAVTYVHAKDESPSAFASCTLRPALGRTLAQQVDLQLLLHPIPRAAADAKAIYGGATIRGYGPATVMVIEVLQDRDGDRAGGWIALLCDVDGRLKSIA